MAVHDRAGGKRGLAAPSGVGRCAAVVRALLLRREKAPRKLAHSAVVRDALAAQPVPAASAIRAGAPPGVDALVRAFHALSVPVSPRMGKCGSADVWTSRLTARSRAATMGLAPQWKAVRIRRGRATVTGDDRSRMPLPVLGAQIAFGDAAQIAFGDCAGGGKAERKADPEARRFWGGSRLRGPSARES